MEKIILMGELRMQKTLIPHSLDICFIFALRETWQYY